jgi:hypothetical protein
MQAHGFTIEQVARPNEALRLWPVSRRVNRTGQDDDASSSRYRRAILGNVAPIVASRTCATETALAGWAIRTRTGESVRTLYDWNCVTTSPEVGASPAAETVRMQAA